ncbi:MAG: hypothetical protein U1C47_05595 [Hydrogenophaga sp.]|jgi:hypothetical protein|nr:hypothetical protein [Hydrogenophaga sp.]MDZ4291377.1 hypothetical protein [Hydrogenophaga sp.]
MVEPKYPKRVVVSKLDGFTETLATWLRSDQHRGKRELRTVKAMYEDWSNKAMAAAMPGAGERSSLTGSGALTPAPRWLRCTSTPSTQGVLEAPH